MRNICRPERHAVGNLCASRAGLSIMTPSSFVDERCQPSLVHSIVIHLQCRGALGDALQFHSRYAAALPRRARRDGIAKPHGAVLAEFYQGQGSSSCPPVGTNMNAIADTANVIALSFAVTPWDQLGWMGTYARPASNRGAVLTNPRGSVLYRHRERRSRILPHRVRLPPKRSVLLHAGVRGEVHDRRGGRKTGAASDQPVVTCTMIGPSRVLRRAAALERRGIGIALTIAGQRTKGSEQVHA